MNVHVSYKVPQILGGPSHLINLVTLCTSCQKAISTADFEVAYKQCMKNYTRAIIPYERVDYGKDRNTLQHEALEQLEDLFLKYSKENRELAGELLSILKKLNLQFHKYKSNSSYF